ncbi:MAG: low molecular weight protein-tyrosine-phosphatase [Bacteroidota bacterium]|nr:low molecular weight protein-tyrosine-phosphatase [Bacteroidota bacterium]
MQKILFVCLGNICRSPLAEGIALHLIKQHKLNVSVDSAGTSNYHIGEAPDKRTIDNASKHGVDLSSLRARQFSEKDFNLFDKIFVMDKNNLKDVLLLAKNEEQKNKVQLFLSINSSNTISEVPDPYYGDEQKFEAVYQLVYSTCIALFQLKDN